MNLKTLKTQQAAFQAHLSIQKDLTVVWNTFHDGDSAFRATIIQAFASLGLQATVTGGNYYSEGVNMSSFKVTVPPSGRCVWIEVGHILRFDENSLQSEFSQSYIHEPVKTPMALPMHLHANFSKHHSNIWWHGSLDNERLASIVVDMFNGNRGQNEFGQRSCFVATVVFGERSEEVSILRQWRDERLSQSIVGRALVKTYYGLGPFCAAVVQGNAVVRRLVRAVLLAVCHRLSRRI